MVNSRKYLPFFLLSLTLGDFASSVNILFFLGGGNFSHKLSIWPLVIKLTEQGHNVTFISSNAKQPLKNSKVYDLAPAFLVGETEQYYAVDRLQIRKERKEGGLWTAYDQSTFSFCNLTLNSKDDATMNNLIENGKFDLVIVNSILGECGFLLAHHFGAKHVVFDSTTIIPSFHGIYGIPIEASWVPDMKSQENYPMGLVERMKNVYNYFVSYERTLSFKKNMMELYKDRFNLDTTPDFTEIERNTSLVLVNSHHTIDFARSLPPMFVSIGGMQCWQPQGQLPKEFKEFMDGAVDGVILISFGSTIDFSTISEQFRSIFFSMMRKFEKVRFIWRWKGPLPTKAPNNLMSSKWLPQREILNEKSVKGFMTHCGINSVMEATYYGVPLIALPLFADQDFSAYRIQAQEVGVAVELREFSEEVLDSAIHEILHNTKYKKNMMTRSSLFKDRPNPVDTAVSALEFVLRHDDLSSLKPMELNQCWFTRNLLDVYLAFFILLSLFPFFLMILLLKVGKYILNKAC